MRGDRRGPPRRASRICAALLILAASAGSHASRADVAGEGAALDPVAASREDSASDPLIITFWCGPPPGELDDRRVAEIADAGFTVIGAPCEGAVTEEQTRRALDVAARHGLRMWIKDRRLNGYHPLSRGWRVRTARAVEAYGDHPALAGYFLIDEPEASRFRDLGRLVRELRAVSPGRLAYINLYPNYVPPEYLETASYEDYVERFLTVVRPGLLSYDHYPFLRDEDRAGFFPNLWTIRRAAERHGVPFLLIVLAMPHLSYRDPTEAELAWQVFHALAFGARGISYFTYWTPLDRLHDNAQKFRYGLIENGKPTLHYFQAARLNRAVAAIGAELARYESWGVLDSAGEIAAPPPWGPLLAIDGGAVTAGVFVGPNAEIALLLVNRDHRYGVDARLRLTSGTAPPAAFAPTTRRWHEVEGAIALEPGGARLVRVRH